MAHLAKAEKALIEFGATLDAMPGAIASQRCRPKRLGVAELSDKSC